MNRKKLAVLFGGRSEEYEISLQSASGVLENIDSRKYEIIAIGITREGTWYRYKGGFNNIADDSWWKNENEITPVTVSRENNAGGIIEFSHGKCSFTKLDLAFPVLHGKNGEDGSIQGLFQVAGVKIVGCGTLSSALCMDKNQSHRLAELAGIAVPKSMILDRKILKNFEENQKGLEEKISRELSFPLFVKPVRSGSSFGISKIHSPAQLKEAVDKALKYDSRVILEENVVGFEVGCAILGSSEPLAGRVDEIELSGGFFDFTEKYSLVSSKIHMPARISEEKEREIQETALKIYKILECSGFARVDMFLTTDGRILFNEVNTIPGFTSHSRYPNSLKGIGLSFSEAIEKLLSLYD